MKPQGEITDEEIVRVCDMAITAVEGLRFTSCKALSRALFDTFPSDDYTFLRSFVLNEYSQLTRASRAYYGFRGIGVFGHDKDFGFSVETAQRIRIIQLELYKLHVMQRIEARKTMGGDS